MTNHPPVSSRRYDPQRRDRIIDAALDSIAADGVAGTSHRKVALLADVPLGSMTYHFGSMDELLMEAFTRFAGRIREAFEARLDAAPDRQAALEAIVSLIHEDLQRSRAEHVVAYELYTLAARNPHFRTITQAWIRASRQTLQRHFDPTTARRLDAYIEGAALHIALDPDPQATEDTRAALYLLTNVSPPPRTAQ
jgi:TetR/AcrR family transcriptional regulator, regulator of biofilm formation and stress response